MPRSSKAPLSPYEEAVLQRLAGGSGVMWVLLPQQHVDRLRKFELIEKRGEQAFLTAAGEVRLAALQPRRA